MLDVDVHVCIAYHALSDGEEWAVRAGACERPALGVDAQDVKGERADDTGAQLQVSE